MTARVRELLTASGKSPTSALDTRTVKGTVKNLLGLLGVPAWDVDTCHVGDANAAMHAQSKWKQVLFRHVTGKALECIEKAEVILKGRMLQEAERIEACASRACASREHTAPADDAAHAEIERLRAQVNVQETVLQAQIDVRAKDAEIERLRLQVGAAQAKAVADAEIRRLQAEVQERALQAHLTAKAKDAEIERLRLLNQGDAGKAAEAAAGSACCLVS